MSTRQRGRPKGARTAVYTIQKHVFLDTTLADKLRRLAHSFGVSESETVRNLIRAVKESKGSI